MSPYLALLGVFAFMVVVGAIGMTDVLRGRRAAEREKSRQLHLGLPDGPRSHHPAAAE